MNPAVNVALSFTTTLVGLALLCLVRRSGVWFGNSLKQQEMYSLERGNLGRLDMNPRLRPLKEECKHFFFFFTFFWLKHIGLGEAAVSLNSRTCLFLSSECMLWEDLG